MITGNSYFLKLSGLINPGKEKEFHQTVQFIFNHLSTKCMERTLSVETQNAHRFHVFLLWSSLDELIAFRKSSEFELLRGLFQTIGQSADAVTGRETDIRLFDLHSLNH